MIYVQNNKISQIYFGNSKIKSIYKGSDLIYSSFPSKIKIPAGTTYDFPYTGSVQSMDLPAGKYKLEV